MMSLCSYFIILARRTGLCMITGKFLNTWAHLKRNATMFSWVYLIRISQASRPTAYKKTVVLATEFLRARQNISGLTAVWNEIKPPFSFWKNGFTEGVIKSPFFKDTAVSEEVSPCPFLLSVIPLILCGQKKPMPRNGVFRTWTWNK